jgi:cystathionine beta-lyase/cystathionine gamma-synthase
MIPPT